MGSDVWEKFPNNPVIIFLRASLSLSSLGLDAGCIAHLDTYLYLDVHFNNSALKLNTLCNACTVPGWLETVQILITSPLDFHTHLSGSSVDKLGNILL